MANSDAMHSISGVPQGYDKMERELTAKKNLLAFSAGVDSTALFFLLQELNINFDIAIVNYGVREQSKEEVHYAKELSKRYNIKCHIHNASKINKNFEAKARDIRYDFFNSLISEYQYDNLLTAHHLGDRFEWMLMQFCKGAGCAELSSMNLIEKKENYNLIRPLLGLEKKELQDYLDERKIKYFVDQSNFDENIKRNYFRQTHTKPLLDKYLRGIKKSFEYIDADAMDLIQEIELQHINDFTYFKSSNKKRSDIYAIDKYLKTKALMISSSERELLNNNNTVVLARKYLVNWHLDFVFIVPYSSSKAEMPHSFKERMRILKIEPKLRPYFFTNLELFESLEGIIPLQ